MEFKFPGIGEQALPCIPQSSNYSYFTELAHRAGYLGPPGNDYRGTTGYMGPPVNDFRNQGARREAILLELEKERIRQKRIATEIANKRGVEEELRRGRQLEVERNLLAYMRLPEERIEMLPEERAARRGIEGFETAPFHNRRY
ncbi:Zinc finger RNA-binding protein [Abeliophyllum distichum]|uniref:Zinc finger RNA-binding protein n=1 Tax=Abeliophyllum distichum TaxID=126358 RepID=A0ABD1QY63_9LAMI